MLIKVFGQWINPALICCVTDYTKFDRETQTHQRTGESQAFTNAAGEDGHLISAIYWRDKTADEVAAEINRLTKVNPEPAQPHEMPVGHVVNPRLVTIVKSLVRNKNELVPTESFKAAYDRLIDFALDVLKHEGVKDVQP